MKRLVQSIVLLFIWSISFSQIDLENGLIFHYPFDGTCEDLSANGLDCIPGAMPSEDRLGNPSSAYFFNGVNQIIVLPNSPLMKPDLPMSISFWFQSKTPNGSNEGIFTNDHQEDLYSGIHIAITNNQVMGVSILSGGSPGPAYRRGVKLDLEIDMTQWHHCVINITDAFDIKVWLDCMEMEVEPHGNGSGVLEYTNNPGQIGRVDATTTSSTKGFYHGSLDDFYFWNRLLNEDEIEFLSDACCIPSIYEIDTTICHGDVLIIDGYTFDTEGIYQLEYLDVFDCDSIISIYLSISGYHNETIVDTLMCEGGFLLIGNEIYLSEGSYFQNHLNLQGCDSTVGIFIEELLIYEINLQETICDGDIFTLGTQQLTIAGNYTEYFSTIDGCDSVVFLDLTVDANFSITNINEVICAGENYEFGSDIITSPGVYFDTVTIPISCDSITTLYLSIEPNFEESIDTVICEDDFILFDSQIIDEPGDYTGEYMTINNCDSIVQMNVKVEKPAEHYISIDFCKGDTVFVNDQLITSPISITEIFHNQSCDSLVNWDIGWYPEDAIECMKMGVDDIEIYIPNAFSPNGDGINDFFNVFHSHDFDCEIVQLEIYDRWGSKIVANGNVKTNNSLSGWDGTTGDQIAQNGVYVYLLKIECSNGFTKNIFGDICLMR